MANRLPVVGSDSGTWGTYLNDFLSYALVSDTTTGTAISQAGALSYVSIVSTGTYTIGSSGYTAGNETVLANAAVHNVSITLTDATVYPGIIHTVKKVDPTVHNVNVYTVSSQTIDGTNATSTPISIYVPYLSLSFASDGSNWNII